MYKILICDDERDIRNALRIYLTGEGYAVCEADSGIAALEIVRREEVQLVLMDIMMPGMDGMTATARLREQSNVPVILITAKGEDNDKILGLTVGADDYITKPFSIEELLARIRAALRRKAAHAQKETLFSLAGLTLDVSRRRVTRDGREIELTGREFSLLQYFMENATIVLTREQLLEAVWGYAYLGETNVVDVYVRYLRGKIDDGFEKKLLHTVRGVGYVLREEP